MSLLERLPNEILVEVANFLDSETLLNFRLLNRNISIVINRVILQRFFRRRAVFINIDSLNILRQVSLSEKYRASVTDLNICIHHVPEARYDFELEDISSQARSIMTSNHSHYTMLLRDQKWLMESGQAAAHLAVALKNLPNCVTIEISDLIYDLDRSFQKSNASQLLITRMELSTSIDFVTRLISTTIAAINASDCILETLYIGHELEGIGIQQLPRLSSDQLGLSFSKLSVLCLVVGLKSRDIQNNWEAYLFDWINLFPSLKELDLTFNLRLTRDQFSSIGRGLHVDNITTLGLRCVDCHYDDLTVLLKSHRDTLRHIILDCVDLTGCVNPWRSVLELIRDETLIDSVEIMGCMSNERDIFIGAHLKERQMSIPTKNRGMLDVVIRNLYIGS